MLTRLCSQRSPNDAKDPTDFAWHESVNIYEHLEGYRLTMITAAIRANGFFLPAKSKGKCSQLGGTE